MLAQRSKKIRIFLVLIQTNLLIALLAACGPTTTLLPQLTVVAPLPQKSGPDYPKAEVILHARVPKALAEEQNLYIEILDEVTGLALNVARVQMSTTDRQNFNLRLPVIAGSVLKYRYVRDNDPAGIEYNSRGQQVRYRLLAVNNPMTVQDNIAGWKFDSLPEKTGRIQGQVAYKKSNAPVVNALVTAAGVQTLTASDGSFILEGLPEGLHQLVVYSLEGTFSTFQQGAVVAPDSTTPAAVMVEPGKMVTVTFIVNQPDSDLKGAPVRMVGNTYSLGNTFADLRGGFSVVASRAPGLRLLPDGRYSISLQLPAGLDLRYKYTLGDGFWNAERFQAGGLRLRQLIVPDKDTTIEDSIERWKTPGRAPITFTVTVPADTPVTDTISIQFNPFSWTEPIPMWPLGNNRWFFVLNSPLDVFSKAAYRYCRNDQCGTADAITTSGLNAPGTSFTPQEAPLNIQEEVSAWDWSEIAAEPVVVTGTAITPRESGFVAGVEFMPGYHPTWQAYLPSAFSNIHDIGASTVILTPTWHITNQSPPIMEPVPGKDALWFDLSKTILQSQQKGLYVGIRPVLVFPQDSQTWWQAAPRDDGWWQSWFDRYQTYLVYHADLAAQTGAKLLVIGDDNLLPALPGGQLADGTPSGVPSNIEERWRKLIQVVRSRYTGKIVWMIGYSGQMTPIPGMLDAVDQVYVQISPPLASSDQLSQPELEQRFASIIDNDVQPLQQQINIPVLLGLRFPSVQGALDGCVTSAEECLGADIVFGMNLSSPGVERSLRDQANAYSALLTVLNQRPWISGIVAAGYYPPVELKDSSISVRSKPAGDVLWYWYPRLLGKVAP